MPQRCRKILSVLLVLIPVAQIFGERMGLPIKLISVILLFAVGVFSEQGFLFIPCMLAILLILSLLVATSFSVRKKRIILPFCTLVFLALESVFGTWIPLVRCLYKPKFYGDPLPYVIQASIMMTTIVLLVIHCWDVIQEKRRQAKNESDEDCTVENRQEV